MGKGARTRELLLRRHPPPIKTNSFVEELADRSGQGLTVPQEGLIWLRAIATTTTRAMPTQAITWMVSHHLSLQNVRWLSKMPIDKTLPSSFNGTRRPTTFSDSELSTASSATPISSPDRLLIHQNANSKSKMFPLRYGELIRPIGSNGYLFVFGGFVCV